MAIFLDEADWSELYHTAEQHGESVYQQTPFGFQHRLPQQFGAAKEQTVFLRDGLILSIREGKLSQDLHLQRHHESCFPLTAKFFVSGHSRVRTAHVPGIADEYEEITGCHYLYCLPELTEIEEWKAKEPIQIVMVYASLDYFKHFESSHPYLPIPLKQLVEAESVQPFHHSLGRTTPAMEQVLRQILDCPHQGLMQHLYLESKALELLVLQLAEWVEPARSLNQPVSFKSDDIDRLYAARTILMQRASNPPSLLELARQVGLNDYKLNPLESLWKK